MVILKNVLNLNIFILQRKEAELLKTFLPAKFEYVLFVPMTEVQVNETISLYLKFDINIANCFRTICIHLY